MKQSKRDILWSLFPTIYLPGLVVYTSLGMLIPTLPEFADTLNAGLFLTGIVLAADSFGQVLSDLPTGYLLGRLGRKRSMVMGIAISAVSTGSIYFATNIWHVFVLLLIGGFGIALYSVARHTYLADEVSVESRGVAISTIGGVFRAGNALGPFLGGTVIATYLGLRATFVAFFIISIIGALCVLFFVEEDDPTTIKERQNRGHGSLIGLLREHGNIIAAAGAGQFFGQMVRVARRVALPLFALRILGLDVAQVGIITSVSALVDMPLFPLAGMIMDRWGRKYAIVPSFALQGLGVFLISFTTGFWSLLAVGAFIGLANGISAGTMMTLGADLSPPGQRGEFLGLWRLIGDGGFMIAPLLVGAVANALTLGAATVVLSTAGFISAGLFAWLVPETLKKKPVVVGD